MLKYKSLLHSCRVFFVLVIGVTSVFAQDIWSVQSGNWSDDNTWNLGRVPIFGEWVLVSTGTTVKLDRGLGWDLTFFRLDVDGTLYPEIEPDALIIVILRAENRIQVSASGCILGYDSSNVRSPENTGVSADIVLIADEVINDGLIQGGNNFWGNWGEAHWSAPPSQILIKPHVQFMPPSIGNFTNTGSVIAGSAVMGENLASPGGSVFIFMPDTVRNNDGGLIHAGDGYISNPPPEPFAIGLGGDIIIQHADPWWLWEEFWWWWEPDFGVHVIDGDGGHLIGGCDDGPFSICENFTNYLWMTSGNDPGDYISFSGPGTLIDQFGLIDFRSWDSSPASSIFLASLDSGSIYARRNYTATATSGPANGGFIWVDYLPNSWVDMTGNPNGNYVLMCEEEDPGGEFPFIRFSHFRDSANIMLDPGVSIDSICTPAPMFWGERPNSEAFSIGRLYHGIPDLAQMSEPYLVPGLGFPGDTAEIFCRFVNLGQQHTFRIQIDDERGYNFYPHNIWVDSLDTPDTTFCVRFRIPNYDTVGTVNPITVTSSTYPDGQLADTLDWKVVVVPPVKVYPEQDFYTAAGNLDTISVVIWNHMDVSSSFDIYRTTQAWSVHPGYYSRYIPAHDADTVNFYVQVDSSALPGDSNWVAVRAEVSEVRQDYWDSDTTMITVLEETLPAPSGLVITIDNNDITLEWVPVLGALSYHVYWTQISPQGPWIPLAITPNPNYLHAGIVDNHQHVFYRITAYNP